MSIEFYEEKQEARYLLDRFAVATVVLYWHYLRQSIPIPNGAELCSTYATYGPDCLELIIFRIASKISLVI